jgi:transposase
MDELLRIVRMYVNEKLSTRDIAAIMGLGDATIRRRLHAAGVVMRSNAPRSRLRRLDQARLFASIAEHGVRKTAKRWHIQERTLKYYLAGLRAKDKGGCK